LKLNPTPSWGGTEVGDYQGLPSKAKNDKQIASCGVPALRFADFVDPDDEDINLNLAINAIDIACKPTAEGANSSSSTAIWAAADVSSTESTDNHHKHIFKNNNSSNNVNSSPTDSNTNVYIVNSTSGSSNYAGANSLPLIVKDNGGRVFRATKQTKHNKSATRLPHARKPTWSDPVAVPDRPSNLPNSATNAALHTFDNVNSNMHNNISNSNFSTAQRHKVAEQTANDIETFSAKRRRLQARPFPSTLANTNLLHNTSGGTIRVPIPDGERPVASSGPGSLAIRNWLTRMFHPPD